ncbi:hypothetical protein E2F43_18270 [Seongchinamella unica]|uniref:Uncharacterized protein n=1 Tax=Seongchinamella unica TaxID=2547392 RepID=A0A4R5LN67_9GAMM|nr:hypothetical protein [Seongchinamella unica]TDG11657.1 hypothetical protein E2F43_18270 [Seongchinamella unica]
MNILDELEERFETAITRNPALSKRLNAEIEVVHELREQAETVRLEILDNANALTGGDAKIEHLLANPEKPLISGESLLLWAAQPPLDIRLAGMDEFYKDLAEKLPANPSDDANHGEVFSSAAKEVPGDWSGVTLELRAANKLRVIAEGYRADHDLEGTPLIARRDKQLNSVGTLLLTVADAGRVPNASPGKSAPAKQKTLMSKLRKALREITGIAAKPFSAFSPAEGWKANFTLDDKRNAGEERERRRAKHVQYDDNRDSPGGADDGYTFDAEDDEAGNFIKGTQGLVDSRDKEN